MRIIYTDVYGFQHALRGMRNPKNSWGRTDSVAYELDSGILKFSIGNADIELSKKLVKAGTEHCKHLRMIQVWADVKAPRYWWQEFDTYKHVEKISCSTMHTLFRKEMSILDFEFISKEEEVGIICQVIDTLNELREEYIESSKERYLELAKTLLPESYLQKRTINTNYQQLLNIYHQRKNHRLPQWKEFCKWIEELPYFKELTGIDDK
ncbi:thymidylate synthase complementing protein [Gottschalkia purinilytica]|uniref:Thymidylate synthase complementing protein n=1 Tax=Gottschalkia purinilytica TaxID=1503 RepID=A0A0L0W620_GOTPU|nr:hypothetical protein [Gottschalkia purinilytica]KNF06937.1 thymidylate synthase complementing protein [Gottschalkia purinilytica]